jgi:hypothetical protein
MRAPVVREEIFLVKVAPHRLRILQDLQVEAVGSRPFIFPIGLRKWLQNASLDEAFAVGALRFRLALFTLRFRLVGVGSVVSPQCALY